MFVSALLHAEGQSRGTRSGTRKLTCFAQAVLVIRWFLDGTRLAQLAGDNKIGKSTAYDYLHEGIDALAGQAPSLQSALLAAKMAGHTHVIIDATLIETDRVRAAGPTPGVDLFWSATPPFRGRHDGVKTVPVVARRRRYIPWSLRPLVSLVLGPDLKGHALSPSSTPNRFSVCLPRPLGSPPPFPASY